MLRLKNMVTFCALLTLTATVHAGLITGIAQDWYDGQAQSGSSN